MPTIWVATLPGWAAIAVSRAASIGSVGVYAGGETGVRGRAGVGDFDALPAQATSASAETRTTAMNNGRITIAGYAGEIG
jgi:hypothetical protein